MSTYMLSNEQMTTLDPVYLPSLSEWMSYTGVTEWEFYCSGMYLTVQMTREQTLTDVHKQGVYLLSTVIKSEANYFREYIDGKNRSRWKELIIPQIALMAERRAKLEAQLRKDGLAIDENYVDPPLPSLTK